MNEKAGGRAYTRTSPLHLNININTHDVPNGGRAILRNEEVDLR